MDNYEIRELDSYLFNKKNNTRMLKINANMHLIYINFFLSVLMKIYNELDYSVIATYSMDDLCAINYYFFSKFQMIDSTTQNKFYMKI
jgi:hypothetical protein